jgi:hypothetical protein
MPMIEIDPMSIDQLAGAVVLFLGAVGSLLLVVWQSKCLCKVNLCYIFQCERRPPNEDELKTLADEAKSMKNKVGIGAVGSDKKYKEKKLEEDYLKQKPPSSITYGEQHTQGAGVGRSPQLIPKTSKEEIFYDEENSEKSEKKKLDELI